MAWIHGTDHWEELNGTNDDDGIYGLGGNDLLYGHGGNDLMSGDDGNDHFFGGMGGDFLHGDSGNDRADYGDSAVGVTVTLETGRGYDGTAQGDWLYSIENLDGSAYDDTLVGDGGGNILRGETGNDTLKGGGGADTLSGEFGDDTLKGGGGADNLYGGPGIDTLAYNESPVRVMVALWSGVAHYGDAEGDTFDSIENLTGSAHNDGLVGDDGVNVLQGLDGDDDLKGMGGADSLWGGNGHDALFGHDGTDTLRGEAGNDGLDGGSGADTMIGGWGNDTYYVDHANDVVSEYAGQGVDMVRTSVSYVLAAGADVETLRTINDAGTAAINLTGNSSGNQIIGNDGPNGISGGGGADQMIGRNGSDLYFVDHAGDSVTESGGQGVDSVWTSVSWTLTPGADVETLRTTNAFGTGAINLTGNSSGNSVQGNDGNNVINGGDGNDQLSGRFGQDSFLFNTQLNAATNVDQITDFSVADDTIRLEDTVFSAFATGGLAEERVVIGTALQANDNIIYNPGSGALFYDSDGNGAAAAIQFAAVTPGLALTHLDFLVV